MNFGVMTVKLMIDKTEARDKKREKPLTAEARRSQSREEVI